MTEISDETPLPLRERVQDWTEYDVASFYLGKALGVICPSASYTQSKSMFFGSDNPDGVRLFDVLIFLADQGILESRDNNFEFRWRQEPQ